MSNPLEPTALTSRQFLKLAKETQLVLTARELAEARIAVASQLAEGELFQCVGRKGVALTFTDFLVVLSRLAPKFHPRIDSTFAFQKVLLENVLPLAQRRNVVSVDDVLAENEVENLLGQQFASGLDKIFDWYAGIADWSQPAFATKKCLDMAVGAKKIGYAEFLKFSEHFQLFESHSSRADALLSVRSVGDAYLSATQKSSAAPCILGMMRAEFDEALVRLALCAFDDSNFGELSPASKLRALFLYMWRGITSTATTKIGWIDVTDTCESPNANNFYTNFHGSADFNSAFFQMWKDDGFTDYTKNDTDPPDDGVIMLERIIGRAADLTPAQFSRFVDDGATRTNAICASKQKNVPPVPTTRNTPTTRGKLCVSDIKRLLRIRQDIAGLLHHQISERK